MVTTTDLTAIPAGVEADLAAVVGLVEAAAVVGLAAAVDLVVEDLQDHGDRSK